MNQLDIQQTELNLDKKEKEEVKVLDNLIEIQRNSIRNKDDRYMIGLYNGMVLARSVITGEEPIFYELEERKVVNNG